MKEPENPLEELTAGDWIAVAGVGAGVLFCWQFPFLTAPRFAEMFADFGGELPQLTQLAMSAWFPLMLGLNPASVVFHALSGRHTLQRRRLLIVAAFAMALAASAVCIVAIYLPVFAAAARVE